VPLPNSQDQAHLNVWDFGGQEIMHATHQFFLTRRSLYLLVLSGRGAQRIRTPNTG
jgi:internalin A